MEKLQVIIEAYTKPYRDELDKVKQQTTQATTHVEKQTSRMSKSYSKVGTAIKGLLAALSITAILAFGKSCIDLGSDLAEVQNVVDVTFGDLNRQVDAFSKNAIKQFGLSELTAKKYMGTYGAMAKSFGIVGEAGYQMSAAITGLTGDVASFYNLATDEAYTKLKSIFTGETESLKELGVVMTQTALDQYALNNGFGKTTAKMTEQEKVMLRYRFVMSSLADASGDFVRTSDGWANQVRVLQLQFESFKATIGQGLINAFTPVIRVINTILARLQTLANYFRAFTTAFFGNAGSTSDSLSNAMGGAADSSGSIADNMGNAAESAKKMKEYTLGIDELNVLNPDAGSGGSGGGESAGGGVPDFGNMGGTLFGEVEVNPDVEAAVSRLKDALEKLKQASKPTTDAIKKLWNEGLSKLGKFTWTALEDFYREFLAPVGSWVLGEGLPRFFDITTELLNNIDWERLNESLKGLWKAIEPFASHIGNGLLWFYECVLSPLATYTVNYLIPDFLDRISEALDDIDYYVKKVKPTFEWLGEKLAWLNEIGNKAPIIKDLISQVSVDRFLSSIPGFDVISNFCNTIDTLQTLEEWWNEGILPYLNKDIWDEAWLVIKTSMEMTLNESIEKWSTEIQKWWSLYVEPWFTEERWRSLFGIIGKELEGTWGETVVKWGVGISRWWNQNVEPWFTIEKWLTLYESIKISMNTKWNEASEQWKINLSKWWADDVLPWFKLETWIDMMKGIPSAFSDTFRGAVNAAVTQLNKLIDWINKHLYFDFEGLEIMGEEIIPAFNVQLFTIPHIPQFATGGFPEDGLFMANSNEMVGKFSNGRTAVANNDQIVSGIQRGVTEANEEQNALLRDVVGLLNALLDKDTVIQMDSREVGKSIKSARKRGGYQVRHT